MAARALITAALLPKYVRRMLLTAGMAKPEFTFRYKVRNWPAYNRALVRRGQLTLWFDEAAIAAWRDMACNIGLGRPKVYADAALEG